MCQSTTTTPAVVYFPAGTYLISSSIVDYYITQIIGNPNDLPILKATAKFKGFGLIDGDTHGAHGLNFGPTNLFYRQIRNLVFDLRGIPSNSSAYGVHWPTSQATSLQNCVFEMSDVLGTKHQGLLIEGGTYTTWQQLPLVSINFIHIINLPFPYHQSIIQSITTNFISLEPFSQSSKSDI